MVDHTIRKALTAAMDGRHPLILASASPRRRELLKQAGLDFRVEPSENPEGRRVGGEGPPAYALRSATAKAVEVSERWPEALVLGADTVVALADRVLGKPQTTFDAIEMLTNLAGRTHLVHTGVVFAHTGRPVASDVVTTEVTFRSLSADEIEAYVGTGEPMDKAGAYGIQGRGGVLVSGINGCYFNVVGLPLSRTHEMLCEAREALGARCGDGEC